MSTAAAAAAHRIDQMPGGNLVLIGFRGSGKTSVGRLVAARLNWAFVDTDERIESLAGRPICELFEQLGPAWFRQQETRLIGELVGGRQQVISVGGGAVLEERNRGALRTAGICVWLTAPAEELYRRMLADPRNAQTRPPLTGQDGLAEVRHLLSEREPLYAAAAHRTLSTAGRTLEEVAEALLRLVAESGRFSENS